MGNAIQWIMENWQTVLAGVGFFAMIANATPNDTDNKVMKVISTIINALGANFNVKGNLNK
ncbi:hypothetical protein [Sulfurovum sp.]|uniref:hypothetical protein n=1 Tax=Sulfurovum sp. TaxID=1969726 RepID=UPI0035658789